jgi:hypothetical protein
MDELPIGAGEDESGVGPGRPLLQAFLFLAEAPALSRLLKNSAPSPCRWGGPYRGSLPFDSIYPANQGKREGKYAG